jgi:hypothetical protein
MATPAITYQKLPGRGVELASYGRLYLGPDHLLQVVSNGYQESYKRFHFSDIQAIILQRTVVFPGLNWVFGALTSLCLGGWLLEAINGFGDGPTLPVLMGVLTVLCAGPLLLNLLLGPTCVCYLRTAVQIERLAALKRFRSAERVLDRLRPMIEAAQGTIPTQTAPPVGQSAGEPGPPIPPAP